MGDEGVDDHIGRASVESEDLLRLAVARKNRDVGDAAKIERHAAELRMAVEKVVHIRNERRALATERHVRRAKISDRGGPREGGDNRWLGKPQERRRQRLLPSENSAG